MDHQELATQLRCPSGKYAAEVGKRMMKSNATTIRETIALLDVRPGEAVLEIGPGNGAFAAEIVGLAEGVTYAGLDWSADMVAEAEKFNRAWIEAGRVAFRHGSSEQIPFPDAGFDKVFTVNTIYFWEEPRRDLAEIRRVLKPEGLFCLAFGDRDFMRGLPFVHDGFTLYDRLDAEALLHACGFRVLDVYDHRETARSNSGKIVDKHMIIMRCGLDKQGNVRTQKQVR